MFIFQQVNFVMCPIVNRYLKSGIVQEEDMFQSPKLQCVKEYGQ